MQYFQLLKFAQIENFLRQQGYSENLVSIVLSKPKNIHKAIGKLINENVNLTEDQLIQKINTLQINPVQPQVQKQTTQDKLLKIFLDDDMSQLQMNKFFKSIRTGYHPFVTKILLNKEIHPHDLTTLLEHIENYENLKQRNVAIDKNINNFDSYATWVNEMLRFSDFDPNAVKCKVDPRKLEGVFLADSINGYEIWEVTNAESLKDIGLGTRWCTRRDYKDESGHFASRAEHYLNDHLVVYTIIKSGNLIAQFVPSLEEFKDTNDVEMQNLPLGLNIDKYVMRAVSESPHVLQYASEEIKNNKEVLLELAGLDSFYHKNANALEYASEELKNDTDFMIEAAKRNINALKYASEQIKNNPKFFLKIIKKARNANAFSYASERLKNNKKFVTRVVKGNGRALKYVGQFKKDKEVVLTAVKSNGLALEFASEELKNDADVVLAALIQDKDANYFITSDELMHDKQFVKEAVKVSSSIFPRASAQLRSDREVVLEAVKHDGRSLLYASDELRNDREVVREAVKTQGISLLCASEQLRNDRQIVLEAVKQNGFALSHAPEQFKKDKEVVKEAVKQDAYSLTYASEELKKDPEILAIVNQKKSIASGWYQRIKLSFARK